MATLTSAVVEAGLGGTVREILVNEPYVSGCWPLGELKSTQARDITTLRNHGTYAGTGFTRGVATGLPEGALGLAFDGNGYVEVPDDGLTGGRSLSLVGGSMDVVFFIKTSTSDATLRCVVQKQATNSSGNGYFAGIQSGAVVFFLRVAGTTIFNFSRGSIADGAWHVVHCYYDPPTQEARIFIDGAQSGATVATTATDPGYVAANLRIGTFTDGAGDFIGTLAYVTVGREGNLTLCATVDAARDWTSLQADVLVGDAPITATYGISGERVSDLVASAGHLTFTLDNSAGNSGSLLGYYSPGHANCRSGFGLGTPVRLALGFGGSTYYKFRGRIVGIAPLPGTRRERTVLVTVADWMDAAARSSYAEAAAQVLQASDYVFGVLVDQANMAPPSVALGAGTQTLGYALDTGEGERDVMLSEIARIASSEYAYVYQKGDTTEGGVLIYETRFARMASGTFATTLTDTMLGLTAETSVESVVNVVKARVYPPTIDAAATTVLFTLLATSTVAHPIAAGETITIEGPYSDPSNRTTRIGGTAMVAPVATTDYTANGQADGGGSDYTSSLTVEAVLGGTSVKAYITNGASATIYLTKFQVRGKGVYRNTATDLMIRDEDSIRKYGERALTVDMPYGQSATNGQAVAQGIVDTYAAPVAMPRTVTIKGNRSSTLMTQALAREVGDRVAIVESVTGLAAGNGYFINQVEIAIGARLQVTATWTLAPAWPASLLLVYSGAASGTHDFSGGALVLTDVGDYAFTFNRSGDTLNLAGSGGGGGGGDGLADSTNSAGGGGGAGGTANTSGVNHTLTTTGYTGKVGAGGAGGRPGTAGGTTEFRIPASTIALQLPGGNGGQGSGSFLGGTSGGAGTGSGNVAGSAGGAGAREGVTGGSVGTASTGAGAGGGGAGYAGLNGNAGGASSDQSGGTGGAPGAAGADAGGAQGGAPGSDTPGGGGGAGGGVAVGGLGFHGGGAGGGAGGRSGNGGGGRGGHGILVLTKV